MHSLDGVLRESVPLLGSDHVLRSSFSGISGSWRCPPRGGMPGASGAGGRLLRPDRMRNASRKTKPEVLAEECPRGRPWSARPWRAVRVRMSSVKRVCRPSCEVIDEPQVLGNVPRPATGSLRGGLAVPAVVPSIESRRTVVEGRGARRSCFPNGAEGAKPDVRMAEMPLASDVLSERTDKVVWAARADAVARLRSEVFAQDANDGAIVAG